MAEDGLSFPEITICNYNPIKTSQLTSELVQLVELLCWISSLFLQSLGHNMTPELLSYVLKAFNDHVDDVSPEIQASFKDYVADYFSSNNRNFSIAEFFKEIR